MTWDVVLELAIHVSKSNRIFVKPMVGRWSNRRQISQHGLLLLIRCVHWDSTGEAASFALKLRIALSLTVTRTYQPSIFERLAISTGRHTSNIIGHTTRDSTRGISCFVNWRCRDLMFASRIKKVPFRGACDRALMDILGCWDPDPRHWSKQCVLLYCSSDALFELIKVHTSSLLHNLCDARLTLLERLYRLFFRYKRLTIATDTAGWEVYLFKSVNAHWIFRRVNLLEDLHVTEFCLPRLLDRDDLAARCDAWLTSTHIGCGSFNHSGLFILLHFFIFLINLANQILI